MRSLLLLGALAMTPGLFGATVYWTDWQSADAGHVYGVITLPDTSTINVTYTGDYYGVQLTGGTNYWTPNAYTGGDVSNAPDSLNNDIIQAGKGTGGLFTFSPSIHNPILALVSVNGPTLTFSAPPVVQNSGCGYWGCDTFSVTGNILSSTHGGEGHGSIEFSGDFSSLSFTESGAENWRGLTVGVLGAAVQNESGVPEPTTWIGLTSGLTLLLIRRRRAATAA
jgi:hypothetical protein